MRKISGENNPYTKKITMNPEGRRLAIPDIHGCFKTFDKLLHIIGLEKNDNLFILGDFISRGPDNAGVIRLLNKLIQQEYHIFPVTGNHEEMAMESSPSAGIFQWKRNKDLPPDLTGKNGLIIKEFKEFMKNVPYFYELEDWIIVHAGFNFALEKPFEDPFSMVWIRDFAADEKILQGKRIVHGHNPTDFKNIIKKIEKKEQVIPLDNGCVYKNIKGLGKLLCFDLDSWEVKYQENIDF